MQPSSLNNVRKHAAPVNAKPRGAADTQNPNESIALQDKLTGLPSETVLRARLEQCLLDDQECNDRPVNATLALLQLENFYEIRTWVGKSEARLLLTDIARILQKSLPPSVLLCRCEHYEFALLLLDECSVNALLITERVKSALQSAVSATIPPQLVLRCSVGLAKLDSGVPSAEVLFARARHSISQSLNRDTLTDIDESGDCHELVEKIRLGLQDKALRLSFQPILNLQEDGLQHYEIRSKMLCDEVEISANRLFELAVKNALGESIDRWVIGRALRILQLKRQSSLRLTVNLTLNSIVSPDFHEWLRRRLDKSDIAAEQLILQISEIDVLIAQHHLQFFSESLSQLALKLSIRHFGCTSDPFRYLPLMQVYSVKLDNSQLENIARDSYRLKQIQQLAGKLNERGIQVIAGMVEELNILPLLWNAQVSNVQGNCIQAPGSGLRFRFLEQKTLRLH